MEELTHDVDDNDVFTYLRIRRLWKLSAGGVDGVTYSILKALPGIFKRVILTVINNTIEDNCIRCSWKCIKIVPIPKPNKDHDQTCNFRPISLIPVLLKCCNIMIKDIIQRHIEHTNVNVRNRSISTCINDLLHRLSLLKINGFETVILSLDISNAYNCVKYDIPINLNLNGFYCRWIHNFLSERTLVRGNGKITVKDGLQYIYCWITPDWKQQHHGLSVCGRLYHPIL